MLNSNGDVDSSGRARSSKMASRLSRLPGGTPALVAFGLTLLSYTLQTEAAQYVQQTLGYRKPFLSLYLGHSGFIFLFPIHLLFLKWWYRLPISHYLHLMALNLHWQLSTPTRPLKGDVQEEIRKRLSTYSGRASMASEGRQSGGGGYDDVEDAAEPPPLPSLSRSQSWRESIAMATSLAHPQYSGYFEKRFGFSVPKLAALLVLLMVAITIPALSWYCAVPMTSMADITALYNTFSVWALVFSVWFLGEKWNRYKILSVLMACGGVVVVAYGGTEERKAGGVGNPHKTAGSTATASPTPTPTLTSSDGSPTATLAAMATRAVLQTLKARGGGDAAGEEPPQTPPPPPSSSSASNPLLGDALALFGAVTMAAYEMAFKLLGTLPDEDKQREVWQGKSLGGGGGGVVGDTEEEEGERLLGQDDADADADADERQHVLGGGEEDDDDGDGDDDKDGPSSRAPLSSIAPRRNFSSQSHDERTAIWTPPAVDVVDDTAAGHGDAPSPSAFNYGSNGGGGGGGGGAASAPASASLDADSLKRKMSAAANGTTESGDGSIQSGKRLDDDGIASSSASSVLDDADADEIQRGSTRMKRAHHKARRGKVPEWVDENGDEDRERAAGSRRRPPSHPLSSSPSPAWIPPPLPFGLHANAMTAGIGLATACILWIGVIIAHFTHLERFEWPHNWTTVVFVLFVILCGIIFNGCFMVLLAIWGPVTASVSCLLSTVAVAVLDAVVKAHFSAVSAVGCLFIMGGFGVLLCDGSGGGH